MDDTFLKHAWCCLSSIGLCGSTSPSRSCHPTVHRSSCSFPTQALSVHQLSFLNPRSMRQQNLPLLTVNFHHHLLPCDSFWFFSPKVCRGMGCCFILFLFGGPASACCIGDLYKISVQPSTAGIGLEVLLFSLQRVNFESEGAGEKGWKGLGYCKGNLPSISMENLDFLVCL